MNPRKIQAIARKEYYHLIRDFRSLYLAFFIPLLLILLFGYALSLDVEHIPTAVVDQDRTAAKPRFHPALDASVYFDVGRPSAIPPRDLTDLLDRNRVILGIVIPPGWTRRSQGRPPERRCRSSSTAATPTSPATPAPIITAFIARTTKSR